MANPEQIASLKSQMAGLRNLKTESTTRRGNLENNSVEDTQQAVQDQVDFILVAPTLQDDDVTDLADKQDDLEERVTEERDVQKLEKDFEKTKKSLSGRPFKNR